MVVVVIGKADVFDDHGNSDGGCGCYCGGCCGSEVWDDGCLLKCTVWM